MTSIRTAIKMLEENTSYSVTSRRYLRTYALLRMQEIYEIHGEKYEAETGKKLNFDFSYDQINLEEVPSHLKSNFPIQSHPNWPES